MNRKQFFRNIIGLVGVASNAKELSRLNNNSFSETPIIVSEITPSYGRIYINKHYISSIDPVITELDEFITEKINKINAC